MIRILYVDDNPDYRELVPEFLNKRTGLTVATANSGNEAMDLFNQGKRFDLIISDYEMPNGTGADLFKFLKTRNIGGLFILFTNHYPTPDLRAKFNGEFFLKIVQKSELRRLGIEVAVALASWNGKL